MTSLSALGSVGAGGAAFSCGGLPVTELELLTVVLVGQLTQTTASDNHVPLILANHMTVTVSK